MRLGFVPLCRATHPSLGRKGWLRGRGQPEGRGFERPQESPRPPPTPRIDVIVYPEPKKAWEGRCLFVG